MNNLQNMKIRSKLIFGFGVTLAVMLILSAVSASQIKSVDTKYSYIIAGLVDKLSVIQDVNVNITNMRRATGTVGIYAGDTAKIDAYAQQFTESANKVNDGITQYLALIDSDQLLAPADKQDRKKSMTTLAALTKQYETEVSAAVFDRARANDIVGIQTILSNNTSILQGITDTAQIIADTAKQDVNDQNITTSSITDCVLVFVLLLSIVALLVGIGIAMLISSVIAKPISELVSVVDNVSNGNLNVNVRRGSKDEIGMLADSAARLLNVFKRLIDDLSHMTRDHSDGEIDTFLDPTTYAGQYSEVATSVNQMVSEYIRVNKAAMAVVTEMVNGNFNADIEKLPGKKAFINDAVDNLRTSVKKINQEVDSMIHHSLKGELSFKIDTSPYKGGWAELMTGLNAVMQAVAAPTQEVQSVMVKLSQGDFSEPMSGEYKGDFLAIKTAVNATITEMASYISEVSTVLGEVSNGDLTQTITREYVGSFSEIKNSINTITKSLNQTMSEIATAATQVLAGARQISESSMDLANGATMQAGSVSELTASVDLMSQQTQGTADNAVNANALSEKSTENAKLGDSEMQLMLASMSGIKESSNNISKIIKVIDDIAFQTNLLALNAAVEAARAGTHGKGFAVVAEEVRNLAARSKNAAKQTTDLIEDSIERVDVGSKTAQQTAESLETIVSNAGEVSAIVDKISTASKEQAAAIEQISAELSQISNVIQSNSATSEESAAAAEELSSQAEVLRQLVLYFKL